MYVSVLPVICWLGAAGTVAYHTSDQTADHQLNRFLNDMYATLAENILQNSRNLKLDDFSWGIFSGTKGHLLGLRDYSLTTNTNTTTAATTSLSADSSHMRVSLEFTVPVLQATWDKSHCMGYGCAMTIELRNASFGLHVMLDQSSDECAIDHTASLQRYDKARCQTKYHQKPSAFISGMANTMLRFMAQALNTYPFEKTVKDNVNYALLHLPLFNATDVRRLCDRYNLIFPRDPRA